MEGKRAGRDTDQTVPLLGIPDRFHPQTLIPTCLVVPLGVLQAVDRRVDRMCRSGGGGGGDRNGRRAAYAGVDLSDRRFHQYSVCPSTFTIGPSTIASSRSGQTLPVSYARTRRRTDRQPRDSQYSPLIPPPLLCTRRSLIRCLCRSCLPTGILPRASLSPDRLPMDLWGLLDDSSGGRDHFGAAHQQDGFLAGFLDCRFVVEYLLGINYLRRREFEYPSLAWGKSTKTLGKDDRRAQDCEI